MIHIATIHWKSDKWIDIQLKYLNKNIHEEFRVYAFLNDIDNKHYSKFYCVLNDDIKDHGEKLNLLAEKIINSTDNEDDLIMFLDGDAFPIKDLMPNIYNRLMEYKLLAIRRKENVGDIIPHPSFCVSTIKFWKEINGNWSKGYMYKNKYNYEVTDPGGYLYKTLSEKKINWYPLLRVNNYNLHPLLFGIYDNIIYHHGAGYRDPVTSADFDKHGIFKMIIFRNSSFILFKLLNKIAFKISYKLFKLYKLQKIREENRKLNIQVFNKIINDEYFYKEFL